MRGVPTTVPHDPANGTYGDCLRTCIASILERDDVPHFAEGGPHPDLAMQRMRAWMNMSSYAPFIVAYPGDVTLDELLDMQRQLNPDSLYVLFGNTGTGDHCVVCRGGEIVWNPSWPGSRIVGPLSNGTWQVLIVGRV